MKKIITLTKEKGLWLLAVAVMCITSINLSSCRSESNGQAATAQQDSTAVVGDTTITSAIDRYLAEEIGKNYAEAEYYIPSYSIVGTDQGNPDDIMVWGDFWVFNYNRVGDTLKCVSGGSHPGLMHIRKTENDYEVFKFDQVADGANYLPSAKKIFGDLYEAFHSINSNQELRENVRREGLAAYVKTHNISATMYQDHGWPAKSLK